MQLNKPFQVPLHGMEDNRIEVSLFEQLGTQTIPDADEVESVCNVPIRNPNGKCSQVKLRVRRGQQRAFPGGKGAAGVEDYLNQHQLEARIQSLFELVLKKQPENPYRFMIQELRKDRPAASGDSSSMVPKVPMAPSGPRPANARPSPAGRSKSGNKVEARRESADTRAALAEIKSRGAESAQSSSLGDVRQASRTGAASAQKNLELAHEVMRMVIRQVVANMAKQSGSLGATRQDARFQAIEHARNVRIARPVIREAYQQALARMLASSLGFCGGGHTASDYILPERNKEQLTEHKELTDTVVKSLYNKAYWTL